MKKTILFFHRLELVDMFAPLGNELKEALNVIHLPYSDAEREHISALGISSPEESFKTAIKRRLSEAPAPAPELLQQIDDDIIRFSNGRFNLNSAIQSDRGFTVLDYQQAIQLSCAYYQFWDDLIRTRSIEYVMHEPTSLMMNFISAIVCKKYSAEYIYQIMSVGDGGELGYLTMTGDNLTAPELERLYANYATGHQTINIARCEAFLNKFRSDFSVYLGGSIKQKKSKSLYALKGLVHSLRRPFLLKRYDKLIDNIEYWSARRNLNGDKFRNISRTEREVHFDDFEASDEYYYYPFHLEPEAVVFYHGDGLYANQVKLIQNIAAQLPPGKLLYVKDHPHEFGYRSADDYLALKKVPNIRLIKQSVPGKLLINSAIGVFTINGTAGFEALLMGKQVYVFGKTFYSCSQRVQYVHHVRDLRQVLYANQGRIYSDDTDLLPFVAAYLEALHVGMVDYFVGRAKTYNIDLGLNIKKIAADFLKYAYAGQSR